MELFYLFIILIILFFLFGSFFYIYYFDNFSDRIKKAIKHNEIVIVDDNKINKSNLPLKKYGIPWQITPSCRVEVIFPNLDAEGNIIYHSSYYEEDKVYILDCPEFEEEGKILELRVARELSSYVIEHFKLEKELTNLNNQYAEVNSLAKLILKSYFYSSQIKTYNQALIEIEKLIDKAKQLDKLYSSFIREGLIGIKISNFNPDNIKNNSLIHQTKSKQLKEEYEYMKDTAKAYQDLIDQSY